MKPSTIHDVAARAGVSISTVSRVLHGNPAVHPARVKRVMAAAKELGYAPNPLARGLRAGSTATVGMVVPAVANPYYAALIESIVRLLQASHREVFLCDSLDDPELEFALVRSLIARQVDGVVVVPCDRTHSAGAVRFASEHVPTVQLDRRVEGVSTDSVGVDDAAGIGLVVDHVAERFDLDSFHFVSADGASSTGKRRLSAFREAARDRIAPDNVHLSEFSSEWGYAACRRLVEARRPVRTIVCGADVIALGVLQALHEAKVVVPDEVVVTGYDDILFAAMSGPPLTTVRQPVAEVAAACIGRLDSRVANPSEAAQSVTIRPHLVVRASSGRCGEPDAN